MQCRFLTASGACHIQHPRPLYRWMSFWLGVLVLLFLAGGWLLSLSHTHLVRLDWTSGNCLIASHEKGFCRISVSTDDLSGLFSKPRLHAGAFRHWERTERTSDYAYSWDQVWTQVRVAHRLLILLFLVPWLAWLAWRWRRQKQAQVVTLESVQPSSSASPARGAKQSTGPPQSARGASVE